MTQQEEDMAIEDLALEDLALEDLALTVTVKSMALRTS